MDSVIDAVDNLCGEKWITPVIIAVFAITISILYYFVQNRGLPPGPRGLPLVGFWPSLDSNTVHLVTQKWHNKYGELYCFNYGGTLYMSLGTAKIIREFAVTKADCFERCSDFNLLGHVFQEGVGMANGENWKVLRKFTLQQFKELGMTTVMNNVSGSMYDFVKETVQQLKAKKGEPVDLLPILMDKCNAIIRHTMFGENGITEQEVQEINESYGTLFGFMISPNNLLTGSLAKYFMLPRMPNYKKAMQHHQNMVRIITDVIERHKSTFNEQNIRDYIDAFLKERNMRHAKNDPTARYFTDRALVSSLTQFVGDGVLSVAIFALGFLKCMVENEEEQEKVYSELKEVVGLERYPILEDRSKMAYTNALLTEIMRTETFFTVFPSLQCIKETTISGYRIPKGSITLVNMWTCNQDPQVYENPKTFNPSRFLPKDDNPKPVNPVVFGIGKRACIGENYTMAQVFLFLSTIVQNFKLKSIPMSDLETTTTDQLILSGNMKVIAEPRN